LKFGFLVKVHQVEIGMKLNDLNFIYLGLLMYSDHVNSKKGHFAIFIQRRVVMCNIMIGSKTVSLR
jgi:hypothetical protein